MSTHQDTDHEMVEFVGDITDYWTYTQVRDWVLLQPDLTRTSLHLYLLLRSMVSEAARRSGGGLRRMSIDQLCWLLPGINDKPASPTMVKDALRLLAAQGLVVNPDGDRLVTSAGKGAIQNTLRRYQVNDLPPDAYTGWRNVWDKLDAYTPDWRDNPAQPPTHTRTAAGVQQSHGRKTDHRTDQGRSTESAGRFDGRKSVQPGRKSVQPGRKSDAGKLLTSGNAAPKEGLLRSSSKNSLSPVVGQAGDARARGAVTERETMASPTDKPATQLPSQRAGQKQQETRQETTTAPRTARTTQRPQEAAQKPAGSRQTAEQLVRAAAVVQPGEEPAFIAWATATHKPRGIGWWRTVAKQGDLPGLVADWRATQQPTAPKAATAAAQITWWECTRDDCSRVSKGTRPNDGVCGTCRTAEQAAAETSTVENPCPGHGGEPCGRPANVGGVCVRCRLAASAERPAAARR